MYPETNLWSVMSSGTNATLLSNSTSKYEHSGGSRGGALGAYAPPFKNSKKNDFFAIFEGFWTIKQFLYALHY